MKDLNIMQLSNEQEEYSTGKNKIIEDLITKQNEIEKTVKFHKKIFVRHCTYISDVEQKLWRLEHTVEYQKMQITVLTFSFVIVSSILLLLILL